MSSVQLLLKVRTTLFQIEWSMLVWSHERTVPRHLNRHYFRNDIRTRTHCNNFTPKRHERTGRALKKANRKKKQQQQRKASTFLEIKILFFVHFRVFRAWRAPASKTCTFDALSARNKCGYSVLWRSSTRRCACARSTGALRTPVRGRPKRRRALAYSAGGLPLA